MKYLSPTHLIENELLNPSSWLSRKIPLSDESAKELCEFAAEEGTSRSVIGSVEIIYDKVIAAPKAKAVKAISNLAAEGNLTLQGMINIFATAPAINNRANHVFVQLAEAVRNGSLKQGEVQETAQDVVYSAWYNFFSASISHAAMLLHVKDKHLTQEYLSEMFLKSLTPGQLEYSFSIHSGAPETVEDTDAKALGVFNENSEVQRIVMAGKNQQISMEANEDQADLKSAEVHLATTILKRAIKKDSVDNESVASVKLLFLLAKQHAVEAKFKQAVDQTCLEFTGYGISALKKLQDDVKKGSAKILFQNEKFTARLEALFFKNIDFAEAEEIKAERISALKEASEIEGLPIPEHYLGKGK